jgi:hypothetical protein
VICGLVGMIQKTKHAHFFHRALLRGQNFLLWRSLQRHSISLMPEHLRDGFPKLQQTALWFPTNLPNRASGASGAASAGSGSGSLGSASSAAAVARVTLFATLRQPGHSLIGKIPYLPHTRCFCHLSSAGALDSAIFEISGASSSVSLTLESRSFANESHAIE